MKKFIFITALVLCGCSRSGIPASEAAKHVGEHATVYGKVFGSKLTRGGTVLLDIGGAYPNEQFTIVEFHGSDDYGQLVKLEGQTVTVTGTIKDYRGKPEIIIKSPEEISR